MSGNLLRTAVYANDNTSYFVKNGDAANFTTINTVNAIASTIVLNGGGTIGDGFPALVLNGQPIVFSGSGDYDNTSMGIQQAGSVVIPYGETNVDRNVIQIFCEGTGSPNVPGKILTGGVYFNPQQSFISPSTICSQITGDAAGNIVAKGLSFTSPFISTPAILAPSYVSTATLNASLVSTATLNATSSAFVAGKPVVVPSKVAWVGVSGSPPTITVPISTTQTISANFSVRAGRTYRVSLNAIVQNTSTEMDTFSQLILTTDPSTSVQQVIMGTVVNGTSFFTTIPYMAVFTAISDSSTAHIVCQNSSALQPTSILINAASLANNPNILVEDLGVL